MSSVSQASLTGHTLRNAERLHIPLGADPSYGILGKHSVSLDPELRASIQKSARTVILVVAAGSPELTFLGPRGHK